MSSEAKKETQRLRERIATWENRAVMARYMGNERLAEQALENKRQYQNQLAVHQEMHVDNDST